MEITTDTLHEVVDSVWVSMLGLDMAPSGSEYNPNGDKQLTGCVTITGTWQGAVMIELPEPLARVAAATMFGLTDDELGDEEVLDSLGELANMIGGNIKGLIEGDCKLSLPTVAEGGNFKVSLPGGHVETELVFDAAGRQFQVQVLKRSE